MKTAHGVHATFARHRSHMIALLVLLLILIPQLVAAQAATPGVAPASTPRPEATGECIPSNDLAGRISADGRVGRVINRSTTCTYTVGMAAYRMLDWTQATQRIFDYATAVIGPRQVVTLQVELPPCQAQIDLFEGAVPFSLTRDTFRGRFLAGKVIVGEFCNPDNCTLTQGYWQEHPEAWPVTSLQLGSRTYTQAELLAILEMSVADGNGLVSLAHQLIAAKLNLANGANGGDLASVITAAETLIGSLVVGQDYLEPNVTSSLVEALDAFNNGVTGPGHCDDDDDGLVG